MIAFEKEVFCSIVPGFDDENGVVISIQMFHKTQGYIQDQI